MNDLKLWLEARDTFLGINFKNGRDYHEAFNIAEKSKHPDAVWFCNYFKNLELPNNREDAIKMLPNDHIYRNFLNFLDNPFKTLHEDHYNYCNKSDYLMAAKLGNVYAMRRLSFNSLVWLIRSFINNYDIKSKHFVNVLRREIFYENEICFTWGKELNNLQNKFYMNEPNVKICQEYYKRCIKNMMETIHIWSLFVIRNYRLIINRDVRKLIIEYILVNDVEWGKEKFKKYFKKIKGSQNE